MPESTDRLIERLAATAEPVRRLRPPLVRAMLWLLGVACAGALAIPAFGDFGLLARRLHDSMFVLELFGTAVTGVSAVIAAFQMSLHDRSLAWQWLPLPALFLWLAGSTTGCYREWIAVGTKGWEFGESAGCLMMIVAFSLPLGTSLLYMILRARPLFPGRVAAMGGLGVAAFAAFLLDFNHKIDASFLDLGWHAAAVCIVVATCWLAARGRRKSKTGA